MHARRWVIWGIPAFLFLIAFFHRPAPGVLARDLMQAFGGGGALVGLLGATYFYAYAALMIPAGVLLDAWGVRRVVAGGGAIMGLGSLLMAAAATPLVLFTGRFVVGLGAAVTFVGALKVAAAWFPPSRFGTLSALTATMGVIGALAATAPLAWLVSLAGWRGALALVGIVTVVTAGLCLAVVRDRPEGATVEVSPGLRAVMRGAWHVAGNPHTWPPFLAFFFLYSAAGNQMLWIVPYLRDVYGLPTTTAAGYATATATALLVSAPLTGWLSDAVLGRRKLPFAILAGAQLLIWLVFVATLGVLPLGTVYPLLFLLGVVSGAFVLVWPIGREVNPPHLGGVAVAIVNFGGFLGAALTQGPVGAVLDARWTGTLQDGARVYTTEAYRAAFGVCALFVLLAAAMSLLLRETRGRNISAELRGAAVRS